jgi:predicted Zn-dependent peptidase
MSPPSTTPRAEQKVFRTILDNGLTVLTEQIPTVRSAAVGVWLKQGSRHEPVERHGIAHFLEHLVFKGTSTRSSREIAVLIDRMGGALDAFTSREFACYYAHILDTHLDEATDLLADITRNPAFPSEEIARERNVIFEEIKMVDDSPEDLAYDLLYETMWPGHRLGRSIQGNEQTVGAITDAHIRDYFDGYYVPSNLIVAAAGNLTHEQMVEMVGERFGPLEERDHEAGDGTPETRTGHLVRHKADMEQAHVLLGFPSYSLADERRYALGILIVLLGGGMSSRLWQAVREERGLAYSVYAHPGAYSDTGNLMIYAGTSREKVNETIEVVSGELKRLKEDGLEAREMDNAREHLKGGLTLGLESTSNRMSNLARQEIYYGRQFTLDEVLEKFDAVTPEQIQEAARDILDAERACTVMVGNVEGVEIRPEALDF